MSGALTIEIARAGGDWDRAFPDADALLRRAAGAAWRAAGPGGEAELSVLLTDDEGVRDLNRDYRGKDLPTNVLSFPAGDRDIAAGAVLLGDIVLALETIEREAAAQAKAAGDHLAHLTVHGVLHLLGHDHETEAQAGAMEALETDILRGLGIADPYAVAGQAVG